MRYTLAQKLGHIGRVIIAWFVAYAVFGWVRMYGIGDMPNVEVISNPEMGDLMIQLVVISVVTGILYGLVDLLLDRPRIQRLAYWKILSLKTLLNLVIVMMVLVMLIMSGVRLGVIDPTSVHEARGQQPIVLSKPALVFIGYFLIVDFFMSIYQQVKQKFGKGVFLDMLIGKYHQPKEADRIFMFIDLRSSVSIAEKLGHLEYSYLLQDCYFDLNTQLSKHKARIYQYVGDEVVLYWDLKDGLADNNCIRMFFGFMQRLEKRSEHYHERYGMMPYFKAGAHIGRVTVAEVGLLKRDIAFHGDTVNTTSRIQGQCNNYEERLLISKDLLNKVMDKNAIEYVYLGDEVLRGKYSSLEIYGISDVVAG